MAIPHVSPSKKSPLHSSSKIKKALETKKKIIRRRATDDPKSKPKKVVSFSLEKSIVSYDPKAAITSAKHDSDPRQSSPMERAEEVQANLLPELPSFVKPMLPSHVAGGFWLSFPKRFCDLHLPKHDDIVILVDESEQEFETKYLVDKNGLSGGWRGFSIAHKLLEKDVLVFQLIAPCKFKVYIIRANVLTEIDGAIGLLNLESFTKPLDIDHKEKYMNMTISSIAKEKHSESHLLNNHEEKNHQVNAMRELKNEQDTTADQSGMDSDDFGIEYFEGIRFSQNVVDIKDVTGIENFNIVVDGLIIDSEIPSHLRVKYYELCFSQNSYLHEQLLKDLNLKLVGGIISEIINIADAIRSCKVTDSLNNLKTWDNTLKAFEDLGMKVGFLRDRISKLLTLSSDSEEEVKNKKLELVKAEEEMRFLEIKLSNVKDVIKNLDDDIEASRLRGKKLEVVFTETAKAPW